MLTRFIKIIARSYRYNNYQANIQQSVIYGQSIAQFLLQQGIPAQRLLVFGAGSEQLNGRLRINNIDFQVMANF